MTLAFYGKICISIKFKIDDKSIREENEMKKNYVYILIIIFGVILTFLIVGFLNTGDSLEEKNEVADEIEIEEDHTELEQIESEILENENPLTGLPTQSDEAIGLRPVAVMVSNVRASMPQNGIGAADLIFEIPIEGGATRLMAIYGDMTQIPQISPIRSARTYFPVIVLGFNPFFVHWGNDPSIDDPLNEMLGNDRFNGNFNTGGLFGRDQERLNAGFALDQTAYFNGVDFKERAENMNLPLELHTNQNTTGFLFNPYQEIVTPEDGNATNIHINFGGTTADLKFNEETRLYHKYFNGTTHIDGMTGEQLVFTNLFVLETDIWISANGHNDFNLAGTGFYFSDGGVKSITWEKGERLYIFDESGNEVRINRGKSYIAVTRYDSVIFES